LLEAGGDRLFVDVVPATTIVVRADRVATNLGVGDRVEVWGKVTRSSDAYRGQPARLSAGDGRLYIFEGGRTLNRRLMLAAVVEFTAAVALVLVGVTFGFFVFDRYLFLI